MNRQAAIRRSNAAKAAAAILALAAGAIAASPFVLPNNAAPAPATPTNPADQPRANITPNDQPQRAGSNFDADQAGFVLFTATRPPPPAIVDAPPEEDPIDDNEEPQEQIPSAFEGWEYTGYMQRRNTYAVMTQEGMQALVRDGDTLPKPQEPEEDPDQPTAPITVRDITPDSVLLVSAGEQLRVQRETPDASDRDGRSSPAASNASGRPGRLGGRQNRDAMRERREILQRRLDAQEILRQLTPEQRAQLDMDVINEAIESGEIPEGLEELLLDFGFEGFDR